jgi:hypothetical protein
MGTVHHLKTPDQVKQERLSMVPDDQLGCRLRHNWPRLKPGRKTSIPKNMRLAPQRDGCVRLVETCLDCGKIRWKLLLPGGIYDPGANWHYIDTQDWKVLSREWGITRQDIAAEAFERSFGSWIGNYISIELQRMASEG